MWGSAPERLRAGPAVDALPAWKPPVLSPWATDGNRSLNRGGLAPGRQSRRLPALVQGACAETGFLKVAAQVDRGLSHASRAGVSIGSLYQFFLDKAAILRSLAQRYADRLHEQLVAFDLGEGKELPLEASIARSVELTDRFFRDHPGHPAIFMDVQAASPELIATVLVKTIGNRLWLSATQAKAFRDRLVRETSELAIACLCRRIAAT